MDVGRVGNVCGCGRGVGGECVEVYGVCHQRKL